MARRASPCSSELSSAQNSITLGLMFLQNAFFALSCKIDTMSCLEYASKKTSDEPILERIRSSSSYPFFC